MPDRPSLRDAQRALTRERLFTGARELFAEKSYLEATIDGIAERAGVARATVYLHYETKGALAQDLLIQDMAAHRRLYHKLADSLDRSGPAPDAEALAAWLHRYARVFNDRRTALSLFNVVIGSDPDFLQVIKREREKEADMRNRKTGKKKRRRRSRAGSFGGSSGSQFGGSSGSQFGG